MIGDMTQPLASNCVVVIYCWNKKKLCRYDSKDTFGLVQADEARLPLQYIRDNLCSLDEAVLETEETW